MGWDPLSFHNIDEVSPHFKIMVGDEQPHWNSFFVPLSQHILCSPCKFPLQVFEQSMFLLLPLLEKPVLTFLHHALTLSFHAEEEGPCPPGHPFPFANGTMCCSTDVRENPKCAGDGGEKLEESDPLECCLNSTRCSFSSCSKTENVSGKVVKVTRFLDVLICGDRVPCAKVERFP